MITKCFVNISIFGAHLAHFCMADPTKKLTGAPETVSLTQIRFPWHIQYTEFNHICSVIFPQIASEGEDEDETPQKKPRKAAPKPDKGEEKGKYINKNN